MEALQNHSKPNVLIIIASGVLGGPGRGLLQFLKNLPDSCINYTLCNFEPKWMSVKSPEFYRVYAEHGIAIDPIRQYFPIDPLMLLRADNIRKRFNTSIVQTHGYKSDVIGFFLKRFRHTPWLAFAHGYTEDNLKMDLYNTLDTFLLRRADMVVSVSCAMRDMLIAKGVESSRVVVVHNAVDEADLVPSCNTKKMADSLGISRPRPTIGVVGRLGREKGHIHFLKALKRAREKIPDVLAIIVGHGPQEEAIRKYASQNGMADSIILTGYAGNVANYYQLFDLLVIPSLSEGLPNVLLEAMALSIPVIASDVGGIPEAIRNGENGILVPPRDYRLMSDMIVDILGNRRKSTSMKTAAHHTATARFSPVVRADRILETYGKILRGPHAN